MSFATVFIAAYLKSFDLNKLSKAHKEAANRPLIVQNEITHRYTSTISAPGSNRTADLRNSKDCLEKVLCQMTKNGHLAGITAAGCLCFHTFRVKYEKIPGGKCKEEAERLETERKAEAERLERERKEEEHRIAVEKAKKKAKKVFIAIASVACVCAVFLILLKTVIIPQYKLNKATQLIESGDYEAAYELLEEIGDNATIASSKYDRAIKCIDSGDYKTACMLLDGLSYKDSAEKLKSAKQALIKTAKVGDIVYFGTYEQDNDTTNGKEDIEWLVLAKENNRILVVSDKALDCKPYNQSRDYVTWETCSLRNWLNNDFINAAFTAEERAKIPTVTVSADKNPEYNTNPGNATKDKVFLLSIVEAEKYFTSDKARMCVPTEYAISNGAYTSGSYTKGGKATCWWWLRSPGCNRNYAARVNLFGSVIRFGDIVDYDSDAVRPAMWITIDG